MGDHVKVDNEVPSGCFTTDKKGSNIFIHLILLAKSLDKVEDNKLMVSVSYYEIAIPLDLGERLSVLTVHGRLKDIWILIGTRTEQVDK